MLDAHFFSFQVTLQLREDEHASFLLSTKSTTWRLFAPGVMTWGAYTSLSLCSGLNFRPRGVCAVEEK